MEDSALASSAATRRQLLRRAAMLGLSAPAFLAALQAGTVWADDGDEDKDDRPPPPPRPRRIEPFTSELITVGDASSSGDFSSSNAGSDPLADGRISLRRREDSADEGRVRVDLRGAAANVSYDVFFQPFNSGKAREALGTIGPTNKDGNLNKETTSALSGSNRVGIFVIARTSDGSGQAGKDQFVSSIGG
jgi:hypothetical protein